MNFRVHFIEKQPDFDHIMQSLTAHESIGFDTEFVGEKTYVPVLCLIQVVAGQDIYLIDTMRIGDLRSFLNIVEDPAILKITHAGDNDYRLLYTLFGTVPKNTFDTQIAAGFVGYNYPAGFAKIVEREVGVQLAKSHTVANWEARPLDPKALDYAVEDVKYLPGLYDKLTNKLRRKHRVEWAQEENLKWENPAFYIADPYKEVLANDHIYQLDAREKVFLTRLYQWRREKAAALNITKESVLQSRFIGTVVRATKDGPNAFKANRTMQEHHWRKYLEEWQALWKGPVTAEEQQFLESLPKPMPENPEREWTMELLYHFVKKQCLVHEISAALLLPRGDFNKLKDDRGHFDPSLLEGWRATLLGPELTSWLKQGDDINLQWESGKCVLSMLTKR